MKRKLRAALAAAAILALAGCATLHSGTVTGKEYTAPYATSVLTCVSYGKYGNCTMWLPVAESFPARWTLDLRNGKDSGSVDVDRATYNRIRVGDQWTDGTK